MSQSADSLQVHLKELMDELSGLATNNVTIAVEDELWLKITEIWASVQCLESNISRKTQELHLSDQKSHKELEWLKTNKWINLQLNVQVVRDQLLMKLHTCKFELAGLEHADTSHLLDHKTKEHMEKAMKGQDIQQQMMKLRGKGNVARDAYIPPEISSSVYKLDVDEDIWQVPHHEDMANFPDGRVPAWLADKEAHEGIQHAQELANFQEELRHCKAELSNLCCWFTKQFAATQHTFDFCNDEDVNFFVLMELHHLHDLVNNWKHHTVGLLGRDGAQAEEVLSPGEEEAEEASSDDDENGELEEGPEAEDLTFLASLDLVLGHED
ncbi:hypothetical protein BS47DRAFT_1400440 [Hydnum rufescens UP504]|uniref:Uncharacterized protein n=1 Tax=Hydnum rufescens UP504 TaxID=1448309 RepID=A0A9P6AGP0_9AGAM|nr:hypothetical protein BS47DRAFT_1400440 [Hydnum rufescens UP504]